MEVYIIHYRYLSYAQYCTVVVIKLGVVEIEIEHFCEGGLTLIVKANNELIRKLCKQLQLLPFFVVLNPTVTRQQDDLSSTDLLCYNLFWREKIKRTLKNVKCIVGVGEV